MCVKNSVCVFLSDSPFIPPPVSAPNRIPLCLSGMCQDPVALFCGNVPPESVKRECLRVSVLVCTFNGTECTFVWTAPLSDDDAWRHATNHTRVSLREGL